MDFVMKQKGEPMSDLISIAEAIRALDKFTLECSEGWCLQDLIHVLEELPSAEPERKTGEWIYHPERTNIYGGMCIECSECRDEYMVMYIEDEKYCRNCGSYNGAKMEVEE